MQEAPVRSVSIGIAVVLAFVTVAAPGLPQQPVTAPAPPNPQPRTAVPPAQLPPLTAVQLDPSRLDFPALWSGESAHKTVVFTVPAAGVVTATAPQPPFSIVAMRVFLPGQKTGGGKGAGGQPTAQPAASNLPQRTSPPWQVTCAAGNGVQIEVAFAPVFDLFKMAAGEKSGTIQLHGPALNAALPVAGMFNGVRLVPLMQVLDADRAVKASSTTTSQAPLTIRFVSTGQPFNATVKSCETSRYSLRGTQWSAAVPAGGTVDLPMSMVIKPEGCKLDSPPAIIEAEYTQGTTNGTLKAPIHWTLVPDPFTWNNFSGSCRGVSVSGTLALYSSGSVTLNGQVWSIYQQPSTEMLQLTFSGVTKPVWSGEVTASPLPAQKAGYGGHLDLGPPSSEPSTVYLNAVKGAPTLGCGK